MNLNRSKKSLKKKTSNRKQGSQHIEGTININALSDEFEHRLKDYELEDVYLVYCQSGGRSLMAVKKMNELGFEHIYHYPGGYSDFVK